MLKLIKVTRIAVSRTLARLVSARLEDNSKIQCAQTLQLMLSNSQPASLLKSFVRHAGDNRDTRNRGIQVLQ